jgi:hypothetical protein
MKKIQEDLLTLKEQCHALLAAKQVLSSFNTLVEEIRICVIWAAKTRILVLGK